MIVDPLLDPIFSTLREIENPIAKRLGYFCVTPLITVAGVANFLIAAGACVATIGTIGKVKDISDFAFKQAEGVARIGGGYSFVSLSIAINPKAFSGEDYENPLITPLLKKWFAKKLDSLNSFVLRIGIAALLPALLVSRIADLALGIIAGIGSLFVFRGNQELWKIAYNQLGSFNILGDITFCVIKIINPDTELAYKY